MVHTLSSPVSGCQKGISSIGEPCLIAHVNVEIIGLVKRDEINHLLKPNLFSNKDIVLGGNLKCISLYNKYCV